MIWTEKIETKMIKNVPGYNLSLRPFKILFSVSFLDDSSLAEAARLSKTFWRFLTWFFRKSRSADILSELSVSDGRDSLGSTIIVFWEDFEGITSPRKFETPVWGGVLLEKFCKSVWIWPIFVSIRFICKEFGGLDYHGFRYLKKQINLRTTEPVTKW